MKWISAVKEMREADSYAIKKMRIPMLLLMEAAARCVFERLTALCEKSDDILILCGTGGNGGDGFALARMLKTQGYRVRVFFMGDPDRLQGASLVNYRMLSSYQISIFSLSQASAFNHLLEQSEWVVDALFGTGLEDRVDGMYDQVITSVNQMKQKKRFRVLSIDIPSGIHADTGKVLGSAIRADETVALCRLKKGHLLYPGRDHTGHLTIGNIGIPENIPPLQLADTFILEEGDLSTLLPKRKSRSHKGLYGKLFIMAGALRPEGLRMSGAAYFACKGAYKMGAGVVGLISQPSLLPDVQTRLPEVIGLGFQSDQPEADVVLKSHLSIQPSAVVVGPGLGRDEEGYRSLKLLMELLPKATPLLVDADGLNLISDDEELAAMIRKRKDKTVFTPHIGEAARLLKKPLERIMESPLEAAKRISEVYGCVTVLKDSMTIVTSLRGQTCFNTTGNNGMSTAGSGDVLSGMIGGLMAQGQPLFEACCCGVFLHGMAGDLAKASTGAYGMMASDIVDSIHLDRFLEEHTTCE